MTGNKHKHRVPLTRPAIASATKRQWALEAKGLMNRPVHPVVRLTDDGPDWGATIEPGDLIGYGMHPFLGDDCLRAAIATCTQTPIEDFPDLKLRKRGREDPHEVTSDVWRRVGRWADKRGLVLVFWDELPVPRAAWIGFEAPPPLAATLHSAGVETDEEKALGASIQYGNFLDHSLVMKFDRVWFDPACSVRPPPGMEVHRPAPHRIHYGVSFDLKE